MIFSKVLVANRGEIAQRIFKACHALGVATVAVYSEADADAPWVRVATEAYPLGGVTAAESYLDQAKIFEAVRRSGAEAVHPGYGFLSENAAFAEACAERGIIFIGPSAEAMRLMGSKASAREVAQKAGVPITPGIDGAGLTVAQLAGAAEQLGYPVLIKASAGGGGKGMRVVCDAADFADALQAAQTEARNSFGDEHVILEKFFTDIHHIEVQVLGDEQGTVLHLYERECSIQRRHQKIIEESPAPTIDEATRARMCTAAVALAKQAGYTSAGTVEFMYTGAGQFYLLEMNTRLQVEHPITEAVTGVDLAQWQVRIAAGEALAFGQDEVRQNGHAFECRVYAEDPAMNFLPSIGELAYVKWPLDEPRVRVDAGVATGSVVSPYYDPMLAKVITHGRDRDEARRNMVLALRETAVLGVTTNIAYLIDILEEPDFVAGKTPTRYLDEHLQGWQGVDELDEVWWAAIAAFEAVQGRGNVPRVASGGETAGVNPWEMATGWRNVG